MGSSGQLLIPWAMGTGTAAGDKGNPGLQAGCATSLGILLKQAVPGQAGEQECGEVLPRKCRQQGVTSWKQSRTQSNHSTEQETGGIWILNFHIHQAPVK